MNSEYILLAVVSFPVLGAFMLPIAGRMSEKFRNALALSLVLVSLAGSFALIPQVLNGNAITLTKTLPFGFNFVLTVDALAVFMAIVSSMISAIIVVYSFDYISHYENRDEYYMMVTLFLGSMMGLVFSANLILMYIFWEMTAIASWRLIGFFRNPADVIRADKAFLVTVAGALAMLVGFIMIHQSAGSFDLAAIKDAARVTPVPDIAVLLILVGILSKSATLPFHTWLPDAGVAPSPVTALLHAAVLVKIGVYVFARIFLLTFPVSEIWANVVPWVAAASGLVSAGAALVETDIKRVIAYSTVSQIAFIFLGFAVNNTVGVSGALLYILMHGLAKGGLFLAAGIVEQNARTKDITKMGGLISSMPVTAVSFLFCSFSVMGIPPFGGFFSKYMVMAGAFGSGKTALAVTFLAGACLTIMYLLRLFNMVFLGEAKGQSSREGSVSMVACVACLAAFSLLAGIFVNFPAGFVETIIKEMLG